MTLPIPEPRVSGYTASTPVPLYWVRYGPAGAPPLVVLHGGPGADHRYLLPQMLDLADRYELLFYDQRGGGQSQTADRSPITWRTHVDDLGALVRELAIDPLSLVGYSWGGLLAMLYAIGASANGTAGAGGATRAPPRPARLLLLDPAPVNRRLRDEFEVELARRQQSEAVHAMRDALAASGLRERDPAAFRQRAFEISVAGYFARPERAHDLTPFRVIARVQQSVWESLNDFDLVPGLRRVAAPTLVVHGRNDPIPLESSRLAVSAMPDARLVELDDCGHVPYVEAPIPLFSAMRHFLSEHDVHPSP
ncbi:MAG: alpha/beta fold hydrolase [Gemmatimonadaceae bacterium]